MEEKRFSLQVFAEGEAAAETEDVAAKAENEASPGRYQALEPVLDQLAEQYGVAAGDGEALLGALKQKPRSGADMEELHEGAGRIYDGWMQEAEQLKQVYPAFDIRQELADPRFGRLLRSGVELQTAFEVLHNREIIPAAMQYAARMVQEKMASAMRTGTDRPAENGLRGSGAVMLGSDVSRMSKKDYAAVCRMVERGERVSFG